MIRYLLAIVLLLSAASSIESQHIPHKLDNQWHYDMSAQGGTSYIATVTERLIINDFEYWAIERVNAVTGELLEIIYDRIEGDSLYIRKVACPEKILINFNWPAGYIDITALGNDCYNFKKLLSIDTVNLWGINTASYTFLLGNFCEGYTDTVWFPGTQQITRTFGAYISSEGNLVGAVINGISYGTLYDLPVELVSFKAVKTEGNSVRLEWETASEKNNRGFEVLKKFGEDAEWDKAAFIEGGGTTSVRRYYTYNDEISKSGSCTYRLVQYDYDGTNKVIGETGIDISIHNFSLKQNYPNPFNPSTVIEYTLAAAEHVTLKVYDILGREITTLVNDHMAAGVHRVTFTGKDLPSGIYFYVLDAGINHKAGQMSLLK